MMASATAQARLAATSWVKPERESAKPPFKPKAINRYSDKKREMAGGISRLDFRLPAIAPKTKKSMAGSSRFCMLLNS